MRTSTHHFLPLEPDEKPGDPELGGWRPLRSRVPSPVSMALNDSAPASYSPDSHIPQLLTLREALGLVTLKVNAFTLRSALWTLVTRLRTREDIMAK